MVDRVTRLDGKEIWGYNMVFMGVDKVRFRRAVRPGDRLELHARLIYHREAERTEQAKIETQAHVDGELVATATFLIGLFSNTDA
jgi:3-hydroxyacyl-[acyl-carrier-protein] dehydratase